MPAKVVTHNLSVHKNYLHKKRQTTLIGILFSLPAILGFILFALGPMIVSFLGGLTDYPLAGKPVFVGIDNYVEIFSGDDIFFYKSVKVTLLFVLMNVPTCIFTAFFLALLLNNRKIRGLGFFRAVFYIPTVIPYVASAMIFMWLMSPDFGAFNVILKALGMEGSKWIYGEKTVLQSLLVITAWAAGNIMVVFLAGLQGIPDQLYEALEVDGGNVIDKFVHITLPMMTPIIFFNTLMFFIASMQGFMPAAVITQGGPNNRTLFFVYYLYRQAFEFQNIGYACALGWVLFLAIALTAGIIAKTSKYWVFYGDENS